MTMNNVCKFPPASPQNELSVFCFVLETNENTMQQKTTLKHHRMILIEHGEGEMLFDDVPHSVSAGTLIFGFEGESFYIEKQEDIRYLYIDFSGPRADHLFHRFGIYPPSRKNKNVHSFIPFCKDCLLSTQQENIDMVAESVLLYVFSRLSASVAAQNTTIQKIIDLTEQNFRNPELSVALIAKEIGYNPKYLSHFFKEKMNISYSEYLRSFRFKYAISIFELGISSVKNVAFLSGFSDPLYFSNAFKKAVGISPSEFIQNLSNSQK